MVTGDLKRQIDSVWDTIWTGGITNPITILEQITYLLFIKLLDDNQIKKEANAAALGAKLTTNLTFPDGEYEVPNSNPTQKIAYNDMRWSVFCHFDPVKMNNTISQFVFPFIKSLSGDKETAFSKSIKDAVYLIPTPQVLVKVVDTISGMDTNNKDIMGDVYEYLLSKMAANGNNGQFRTPRHIIRMIVELMKPTLKDKIIDPAMGSAGFLVESARYVTEHYSRELLKQENSNYFKTKMFSGFDTDYTMLRIGSMNLMLHDVDNPCVGYMDSLSKDNVERNCYDLIMANPPFKGSIFYENVSDDIISTCRTKKTELLFVVLFTKMLKLGGRCASIVPDGVLFGSDNAHKAVRKELVDHQRLRAVISMPSGVFKPYAGVSTAVIIFDRTDSGGTDKVWFYDMKADGFSLDDKREPVTENDIPDIIKRFENPEEENRTRSDQSFYVPKEEIVNNDYDLTFNKYKQTEYVAEEYPEPKEILADIRSLEEELAKEIEELEKLL